MVSTCTIDKRNSGCRDTPAVQHGTYLPLIDIVSKEDEFLLLADVPGASPESIELKYERGVLTIRAKVGSEAAGAKRAYVLQEYGKGDFERSFRLGDQIDGSRITADFENGVLDVHLPKVEAVKPVKIAVAGK